jgi:ATP-binding cassette subfamily B protein
MASTYGALEWNSIDTETEQLIQQGLKAIFQGRISFVIARLSTIRTAAKN